MHDPLATEHHRSNKVCVILSDWLTLYKTPKPEQRCDCKSLNMILKKAEKQEQPRVY